VKFNNREKEIIKYIKSINDLDIQKLLDSCFKNNSILEKRNFIVYFNKQNRKYELGLTAETEENIVNVSSDCQIFAVQLNELVETLKFLHKNNYIDVVQTNSNYIGKPILIVGQPELPDDYTVVGIENINLAKELALYNCSTISLRPILSELIKNDFIVEDDLKYNKTLDITSTTSKNSNRLVLLNLLGFILSCLAIWFSLKTSSQSQKTAQLSINNLQNISEQTGLMGNSLDSVSKKLKMLPKSISEFEKSINALTNSNANQAKNLKNTTTDLSESVNELKESVYEYKSFIDNYGKQLNEVVSLTDTQLMIWKDQQKVLLTEFSRKPKLAVKKLNCTTENDSVSIEGFIIENSGEIEAEIQSIHVEYLTTFHHFTQQCFQPYRENRSRYVYHCQLFNSIPNLAQPIRFKSKCSINDENKFRIEIVYKSKYESSFLNKIIEINECKDNE